MGVMLVAWLSPLHILFAHYILAISTIVIIYRRNSITQRVMSHQSDSTRVKLYIRAVEPSRVQL